MTKQITQFALFTFLLGLLLIPAGLSAQLANSAQDPYEKVELETPAKVSLRRIQEGPLLRGQPIQFAIEFEGAPKPINMWSARIEYTSPSLTFENLYARGKKNEVAVVISDPVVFRDSGLTMRAVSGLSLGGWEDGEVVRLTFNVKEDAPDTASIFLKRHPTVREGLAHDDQKAYKTYDYERELVNVETEKMPVVDVSEEHPPREMPTPEPRQLFKRE